jgi:protoporphyrin/coproporphyrin ferrochelatase
MLLYDAFLLISFGGPERPENVLPFLENVVCGKQVPRWRLLEVAARYELFHGVSPLNAQNRALLAAIKDELVAHGLDLPVYWGNRHWHPLLADTLRQMAGDGVRRALAFVTSAFGSPAGCRQYLEAIDRARAEVGVSAPQVDKLRLFFNHPGFIEPMAERVGSALELIPFDRRAAAQLVYTAHSIPQAMAEKCQYERQLHESCGLVSEIAGRKDWDLVFQSRSGPPSEPWLVPDIRNHIRDLAAGGMVHDVVLAPIGFLSEHMEVVYDLDIEVCGLCEELGMNMVRTGLVDCHPRFVRMIRELIAERMDSNSPRLAIGSLGPSPDCCPADCCK